ncbi:hypothetical protein TKK_0003537 [Trichogramma kaykai]
MVISHYWTVTMEGIPVGSFNPKRSFSSNGESRKQDLEIVIDRMDSGIFSLSSNQSSKKSTRWNTIFTTIKRLRCPQWMMYVAFIAAIAFLMCLPSIIRGISSTVETKKKVG